MDNPTCATEAIAPDGRPLIEVGEVREEVPGVLTLGGTACVFEGLVVIRVEHPDEATTRYFAQASAGGPERGTWTASIQVATDDVVVIGQTEMGEGPGASSIPSREIAISIDRT